MCNPHTCPRRSARFFFSLSESLIIWKTLFFSLKNLIDSKFWGTRLREEPERRIHNEDAHTQRPSSPVGSGAGFDEKPIWKLIKPEELVIAYQKFARALVVNTNSAVSGLQTPSNSESEN